MESRGGPFLLVSEEAGVWVGVGVGGVHVTWLMQLTALLFPIPG